jgi:hypothetical protein
MKYDDAVVVVVDVSIEQIKIQSKSDFVSEIFFDSILKSSETESKNETSISILFLEFRTD